MPMNADISIPPVPDFWDPTFLLSHARECLEWYARPACKAPEGGLFHSYADDGHVIDASARHLVSSTRLVVQFSWALRHLCADTSDKARFGQLLHSCLTFLRERHRNAASPDGYAWTLRADGRATAVEDGTNYTYGLSFCLLAYSSAAAAGVDGAAAWADETWDTLTTRLWEPSANLYADEADKDWAVAPYRGQNANMHACEAHMAAFCALRQPRHLARARAIASAMCQRQAQRVAVVTGVALVYEHYDASWMPDLAFNVDKPDDRFKPWGFQPGHLFEWAKLLLQLHALRGEDDGRGCAEPEVETAWRLPTARAFFAAAAHGWDGDHGGFVYSLAPPRGSSAVAAAAAGAPLTFANPLKYKWVQLEGAVAAALLARAAPDAAARAYYRDWYTRTWAYAWTHMYDHVHGAYYRAILADNGKIDDYKSPPGKVEYHATGACYDILDTLASFNEGTPLCHRDLRLPLTTDSIMNG